MRTKCHKLKREVCGKEGTVQLFYNKTGQLKYGRVRHYLKLNEVKKPVFEYHKQSKEYLTEQFKYVSVSNDLNLDQTQDNIDRKLKESNPIFRNRRAGSLARLGHLLDVQVKDVDPNADSDFNRDLGIDFDDFAVWVRSRYAKSYAPTILSYVRRYYRFVIAKDLRALDAMPATKKNIVLKSLIVLSKYMGQSQAFRARLKAYDIKLSRPSTLSSFLRIFNNKNSDILKWYIEARSKLRENEALFTKFLLHSGLRTSEAINSFNLIMRLGREGKLSEYYDSELQVLCHFKYPKLFIRRTKNCYITFIQSEFLQQIK
jgi:hypothetical protein